jgi:hypothetical protein
VLDRGSQTERGKFVIPSIRNKTTNSYMEHFGHEDMNDDASSNSIRVWSVNKRVTTITEKALRNNEDANKPFLRCKILGGF